MDNDRHSIQALMDQIEKLKTELIKMGNERGLNDPDTIKLSQKLDELLIKYQKSKR